jgi:lipopolysaccharide transport system ATP-binding protein
MSDDIAIKVENLSKCYPIFDKPRDRLKQMVLPRLRALTGGQSNRYYREFWALRDVSFEIKRGEAVGIIGRNGSGKSTLLQILCGTLNPTSGNVVTDQRISALLELGSGFNPEFTGRENVYLNGALLGLSEEEIRNRFESIVEFADIGQFLEQPVKSYSSGMIVRLAFAVAVSCDPEIFIVDEALAVGDELFQRKCFARLEEIRSSGATVLFVSHSGAQVVELCDRALLLDDGELLCFGPAKQTVVAYQKLIYAPSHKKAAIRSSLANLKLVSDETTEVTQPKLENSRNRVAADDAVQIEEFFDPHLLPVDSHDYESHGPVINTPVILTLDGRKVNALLPGREYRYCYQVDFKGCAQSVKFGMSIKTPSGFSLAGALSCFSHDTGLLNVSQEDIYGVEFRFTCHLNPGVYFMNAGVFGKTNGTEGVLHRRTDVYAFRVLAAAASCETEVVNLAIVPSVQKL